MSDIQIMMLFIAGGLVLILGAAWLLRGDFKYPEETP